MKFQIYNIKKGSVLDEMGVEPKDIILSIDGTPVEDELDIRFLTSVSEMTMEVEKRNGEVWELEIELDDDEDLGIIFDESQEIRRCKNNCVFCFIDQMPAGMRDTLYIKDDDERMSFLYGNYITLTNLSDFERERIVRYHIMPVNISVHATEPELRCRMLHNRFAGDIMEQLQFFKNHGILMNSQIVLCPGYNDGAHLERTLSDLETLYPQMQSVSVVPLGMTKFRENLPKLRPVEREQALEVLQIIKRHQIKMLDQYGIHFVFPGDEFFLTADEPIPNPEYYENFSQIENGVGMIASFEQELYRALDETTEVEKPRHVGVFTGKAAAPFMRKWCRMVEEHFPSIYITVIEITNRFFGESITVSGLMTGKDILEQAAFTEKYDVLLLPENAVKYQTELLLDDITISDLEKTLHTSIKVTAIDGFSLVNALIDRGNISGIRERQRYETNRSSGGPAEHR